MWIKKKREKRSDRKVRKFEKFNSIIHYENITNISPVLNHDLRVPLKEEYLLSANISSSVGPKVRPIKHGWWSHNPNSWNNFRSWARVAFIKPRHVSSRIRGWCSWLERGVARDEAFNTSNLFLRSVYNGVRAKRFFLLNWIIEQVYFSSNKFERSNYKFIYLVSSIISRALLHGEWRFFERESLMKSIIIYITI